MPRLAPLNHTQGRGKQQSEDEWSEDSLSENNTTREGRRTGQRNQQNQRQEQRTCKSGTNANNPNYDQYDRYDEDSIISELTETHMQKLGAGMIHKTSNEEAGVFNQLSPLQQGLSNVSAASQSKGPSQIQVNKKAWKKLRQMPLIPCAPYAAVPAAVGTSPLR